MRELISVEYDDTVLFDPTGEPTSLICIIPGKTIIFVKVPLQ